jgi:sugar fermentation stimulation protein A
MFSETLFRVNAFPCTILRKLNRFAALVRVGPDEAPAHLNNTGRLEDLIWEGNEGFCIEKDSGKLKYRLIAAKTPKGFALLDTNLQERAVEEVFERGLLWWARGCEVRRRPRLGKGFSDFELICGGKRKVVEVKSADMLGPYGEAMWPDCPTERGRRHLLELSRVGGTVLFVAGFPGACCFRPYVKGDPEVLDVMLAVARAVEFRAVGIYFEPFDASVRYYGELWVLLR